MKFRARSDKLADEVLMRRFLMDLTKAIGARALGEPIVKDVALAVRDLGKEPWADEGGISGIIMLSVSGA